MAGGDHDAAGEAAVLYGVGESGGGRVIVGEQNVDARGGDHLSDGSGKGAGGEARVISNSYAFFGIFAFDYIVSDSTRGAADILKGKIVGDNAAPSISAKFDWFHSKSSKISENSSEQQLEQFRQ